MFYRSPLTPSDDRNNEDSNLSGGAGAGGVFVANVSYISDFFSLFLNMTVHMNVVIRDSCGFCQSTVCTHSCYSLESGKYQRYGCYVFCMFMSVNWGP
jgi:hypothetical protein